MSATRRHSRILPSRDHERRARRLAGARAAGAGAGTLGQAEDCGGEPRRRGGAQQPGPAGQRRVEAASVRARVAARTARSRSRRCWGARRTRPHRRTSPARSVSAQSRITASGGLSAGSAARRRRCRAAGERGNANEITSTARMRRSSSIRPAPAAAAAAASSLGRCAPRLPLVAAAAFAGALALAGGQPPKGAAAATCSRADNHWNQRVDALPVAANSDTLVRSIGLERAGPSRLRLGPVGRRPDRHPVHDRGPAAEEGARSRSSTRTSRTAGRYPIPRNAPDRGRPQPPTATAT